MGKISTIGLACDLAVSEQPRDQLPGRTPPTPWFWRGSDLKMRMCFLSSGDLYDVATLQGVTIEVKPMVETDGILYPPDPATAPLMKKVLSAFTAITDPDYTTDTGVQAVAAFAADETDVEGLSNGWLTVVGTTTAGELITFAAGRINCMEDGYASGQDPAPVPLGNPKPYPASEVIASGHAVSIFEDSGGTFRARNASPTDGYEAAGFILLAVASGATANVYLSGVNTACTGLTAGPVFLDLTTPGLITSTVPHGAGKVFQTVGRATSATACIFSPGDAFVMAE